MQTCLLVISKFESQEAIRLHVLLELETKYYVFQFLENMLLLLQVDLLRKIQY